MRDLKSNIGVVQSIAPAAITSTTEGAGVDLQDYGSAVVVFHPGTITDGTHTPTVEESDDNSSFSAVATADLQGTLAALTSDTVQRVGYKGTKRYIRAVSTVAGASTGGVYGAEVVVGNPAVGPIA
ncbi:hypothetical protein ACFVYJ_01520 [Pontibacter sp. JAM-7]|uniref:hypothetical protein n=1 Tax=Pontibacter sp. JAM-7 TaxID=3366581 RepID=UPI003AF54F09